MTNAVRKKSPRAPSIALNDAIEKACKIYDAERCHAAPTDGVAQHMGYKGANNGTALATIASLKYYGLLERPREGMLAASKDVEAYRFAPTDDIKRSLITKWLHSPPVFAELLEKYKEALPSDATLKYELIQGGFSPAAAEQCAQIFRRSVEYAGYSERPSTGSEEPPLASRSEGGEVIQQYAAGADTVTTTQPKAITHSPTMATVGEGVDRIPVRLAGGRRAWIEIPVPFYEADKERLKKQIDLLLTEEEEGDGGDQN